MRETLRHTKAFDYYYELGDKRGFAEVARECSVSRRSLHNWSRLFGWQERIAERDTKNSKRIQKKTDDNVVNTKLRYRKSVKTQLEVLRDQLDSYRQLSGQALEKIKSGVVPIRTINDLTNLTRATAQLVDAYDKLARLDLLLMGEADSFADMRIIVEGTDFSKYPEPFTISDDGK